MSCPNINNEDIRNKINKVVNMLGGRSLTLEEFKNKNLRARRKGLDYFAMDTVYAMWDSFDESTIDDFIKHWEGKPIVAWEYKVDRQSKMQFLKNKVSDHASKAGYKLDVLDIAAFFRKTPAIESQSYTDFIEVLKRFIIQCGGSPLDFNFYQQVDGSIKITTKETLNILPGLRITEHKQSNLSEDNSVSYADITKKQYLYSLIQYETSIESAEQLLSDVADQYSEDEVNEALGMLIKKLCNK